MGKPLRLLMVEDSEDDAELLLFELHRGGYDVTHERVETAHGMSAALERWAWDIIVADYSMPKFDGLAAFKLFQGSELDLPFILVSGTIGEEIAVSAMKAGVHDYIMKGNLARLVPAIKRELSDAEARLARRQAEEALRESEERFRTTFEKAPVGIADATHGGAFFKINQRFYDILGYPPDELLGMNFRDVIHPDDIQPFIDSQQQLLANEVQTFSLEERHIRKDKSVVWGRITVSLPRDEDSQSQHTIAILEDISERKRAEAQVAHQLRNLAALHAIDKAISANTDLNVTLEVILENIIARLHVDAADILLYESHIQTLVHAQGSGFRTNRLKNIDLKVGKGYAGRAVLERRRIHIPDISLDEHGAIDIPSVWAEEGFVTYLGVPLIAKGQVKGVLELYHRSALEPNQEWFNFLDTLVEQAAIAIDNVTMFIDLQRSNIELQLAYDTTLEGWAKALELRDQETVGHSRRVTEMTLRLARALGFRQEDLVHVRRGALLHDIGKMGMPDSILHKQSELSEDEWRIMRQHPVLAFELLSPILFLRPALDIPYYHHEKWDGSGYPRGLEGEQIPLTARIFAVVDVWDALNSERPYRDAWPRHKVFKYIREQAGKHFDPKVVEVFLNLLDQE